MADPPTEMSKREAEREVKKRRLRELRDAHDCVRRIVNHVGKFYRTVDLPEYLDLRLVAGQLARSGVTHPASGHAAWKYLRDSMTAIQVWMEGHNSWRDAVQVSKMPHLGYPSEIKATEFIESKQAGIPKRLMHVLTQIKLDFFVDPHPSADRVPDFWKDAELGNSAWREQFMQKKGYYHHVPFDDDLTDLVLSTVCQKDAAELGDKQRLPARAEVMAENRESGFLCDQLNTKTDAKIDNLRDSDEGEVWRNQVQATMSRIADTVAETLAAEEDKLLGKRYRHGDEREPPGAQQKRQKTIEGADQPQKIIESIEDRDVDVASLTSAKAKPTLERLYTKRKKLKDRDIQLAAAYAALDVSAKKQENDIGRLQKQQREMRTDINANKDKHQQLVGNIDRLEAENKSLEGRAQQLTVQCAALTEDVRKLEDNSGLVVAQCTAFEDENKLLRSQLVSLMARVETLEQAQTTPRPQPQPAPPPTPKPANGPNPPQEAPLAHPQHHAFTEPSRARTSPIPLPPSHGPAPPAPPPSQWQTAVAAIKHEATDNTTAHAHHHRRAAAAAGPRFPRVLDMPTFDPGWDLREEVLRGRTPGYSAPFPRPPAAVAAAAQHYYHYPGGAAYSGVAASYPCADRGASVPAPAPGPVEVAALTWGPGSILVSARTEEVGVDLAGLGAGDPGSEGTGRGDGGCGEGGGGEGEGGA